jgi:hypothetical protein
MVVATLLLTALYCVSLGNLVRGMSPAELHVALTPVGWHGLAADPLNLPLTILRSIAFRLRAHHGAVVVRLPSVVIGLVAIAAVSWLLYLWHGPAIAVLAGALFATASWSLHAARLGSSDSLYLAAGPILLLANAHLKRSYQSSAIVFATILTWIVLLYIPGMIWLILLSIIISRRPLMAAMKKMSRWQLRVGFGLTIALGISLLSRALIKSPGLVRTWLGLPAQLPTIAHLARACAAVGLHVFVRGPDYPQIWLGKSPILDVFTLGMSLAGIYYYATHWRAQRSRFIGLVYVFGVVLIGLGGAVPLSFIIPLMYLLAGAGIAQLLRSWYNRFPVNPIGRNFGLLIVSLAVVISCSYNLRAYFVVWPHNRTTQAVFMRTD